MEFTVKHINPCIITPNLLSVLSCSGLEDSNIRPDNPEITTMIISRSWTRTRTQHHGTMTAENPETDADQSAETTQRPVTTSKADQQVRSKNKPSPHQRQKDLKCTVMGLQLAHHVQDVYHIITAAGSAAALLLQEDKVHSLLSPL